MSSRSGARARPRGSNERCDGSHQHVGGLERLDAAHEGDDHLVGVEAEFGAGRRGVAHGEAIEIGAGGDDVDLVRIGAIHRHQLIGLGRGVGDQSVGDVDDLLLADDPQPRLLGIPLGQERVLDCGERVRGVDQRHTPAVRGQPADLARQPVVGVDEVVVPAGVRRLGTEHARREAAELSGQIGLVQTLERSGRHLAHQDAGCGVDLRGIAGRGGPGEDLDLDPATGEAKRGLPHVHIHSAGVTGARLRQRRGMHRDHRDSTGQHGRHGSTLAPSPRRQPASHPDLDASSSRRARPDHQRVAATDPANITR